MGLGSGIRKNLFRIPDPGVKKAPQHCFLQCIEILRKKLNLALLLVEMNKRILILPDPDPQHGKKVIILEVHYMILMHSY
jgi:hypothetical protein